LYKVKILGAGSIGNHLANASRAMGWQVDICDLDPAALERTQREIYPARYDAWDEGIKLFEAKDAPKGEYDLIFIGTPPDSHMALALEAVEEGPKAILVEKPVCGPGLESAQSLFSSAAAKGIAGFVGYDHVVGAASCRAGELLADGIHGKVETLDVEIREHWGGIFGAHPWLEGPHDSYLGYWQRGGGAAGEHSHGFNMWQHLAHELGAGRVVEVTATLDYVKDERVDYDSLCLANLRTEKGLTGRVVQDVVTKPPRKWARIQGDAGYVEWHCSYKPGADAVVWAREGDEEKEEIFTKTRPDDFIQEMSHLEASLKGNPAASPISLDRGLDTMLVIAAAHKSSLEGRTVYIDYSEGYVPEALKT
jgi:predicted dehydrogenase